MGPLEIVHADAASRRFFEYLAEGAIKTTRCAACERTLYPPRTRCPRCWRGELEWVDLPREGTLFAFTTQKRSLRFAAPDVIGLVELGQEVRILSHIAAPLESLRIGVRLRGEVFATADGLHLHRFRPIEPPR